MTKIRWKRAERQGCALPFFAGLLAGAAFVYLHPAAFLQEWGFLSPTDLERLGTVSLNPGAFFFYVLCRRIGTLWLVAVLSTTFAGLVTTYLFIVWTGVCGGVVTSVCLMRYGVRGMLLLAGGMMPHFLLYVPAFLMLSAWCFETCSRLYYPVRDYTRLSEKKWKKAGSLGNFLLLHGVVIIGAVLESYVNPNLMTELLKIF